MSSNLLGQLSIFDFENNIKQTRRYEMSRRKRIEGNYRAVTSEDGTFSPHISKYTNERITSYCIRNNKNKTKFVEYCCNLVLDDIEMEFYESMPKNELIKLLIAKQHRGSKGAEQ